MMKDFTLAALGLEQRKVALALFTKSHLDEVIVHHLPSDPEKAIQSLTGFLRSAIEVHDVQYLALRNLSGNANERICKSYERCRGVLRIMGIPCSEISETELLNGFGHPALTRIDHLRRAGRNIWPILASKGVAKSSIDAAVLGLYVQVSRMLNWCEVQP